MFSSTKNFKSAIDPDNIGEIESLIQGGGDVNVKSGDWREAADKATDKAQLHHQLKYGKSNHSFQEKMV